jgi:hypothetical protein
MLQNERDGKASNPRERDLIVAYLSYALADVRALSAVGSQLLEMTIATLADETDEPGLESPDRALPTAAPH